MNLIQLLRRATLNVDAILPGGVVSSQWALDEKVDLVNESHDDLWMAVRLARKKWGLQTVAQADGSFTRDGEPYAPSTALRLAAGASTVLLPPDFAEVVRVVCVSDRTVRFRPASYESLYWTDLQQNALDEDSGVTTTDASWGVFYYDLVGPRTLAINPPLPEQVDLSLDYVPLKRPLYYSNSGTVTLVHDQPGVVGVGTTWLADGIYTRSQDQAAELIVGVSSVVSTAVRLDVDYPPVASIASDSALTLVAGYAGVTASEQPAIVSMVPALPRTLHRWLASLTAGYMLRKINPDLAAKYSAETKERFGTVIRPSIGQRQTQESVVTDANELMG